MTESNKETVIPKSVPDSQGRESHGRVLLVDDEPTLINVEARRLVSLGFQAHAFPSAQLALDHLRSHKVDAVVSDISMPDMNGLEFFRQLRRFDSDVPVILRTGSPTIESASEAVELGAFRYLIKPAPFDELLAHVSKAVQLHRLAHAKREALTELGNHTGEGGDRFALSASLDRAIETLWIAFQPIIQANRGPLYGYEALLRSTETTLPHPGAILDAAERLGRLPELGRAIRRKAIAELTTEQSWSLFLNLHPMDLADEHLLSDLTERPEVVPRLVLEITERASLDDVPSAPERIAALREAGCRIAVDDLGAGYAGLSSFVQLEPNIVKLDMSLIRACDTSAVKQRLIRSLTGVCQDMGLLVVAEGIETEAERDILVSLGCNLLQGYRFGRPARPFIEPVW